MDYLSLYKVFVMGNNDDFEKEYSNRFNSLSTLKFDIFINNHQAFFLYDANLMKKIANIRELDKRVSELFKSLPNLAYQQYIRKSLIDEIQYTNEIEGVVSTRKDINDLINEIEKKIKTKNRFEGIVNKYLFLLEHKMHFNKPEDIRSLYDDMLYNEIKLEDQNNLPDGKLFRKDIVHVYRNGEAIHNGIVPEEKIIEYVNKALMILNDESIDVLIRVAIFHYLFAYIHPFYDGNGRIDRFISSYVLYDNMTKVIGFRLSMAVKENLAKYLDAFKITNDVRNRADLTYFVSEFLNILYDSYTKTELYAYEKKQLLDQYQNKIIDMKAVTKNEKLILTVLLLCRLFGDFGISRANLVNASKLSSTTITTILNRLKKYELYNEIKSGRYVYYQANLEKIDELYSKQAN